MAAPFRLARVLHLREQIRRLRAHEVDQLTSRLAAARAEGERIVGEREVVGAREAEEATAGRLTPETLRVGRAYDAALATAEQGNATETARVVQALAAKRAELLRDRQEEEKYVRLAAAHRQRVLEDEAREIERDLDEVAVDRHRRNRRGVKS